jgi:hypothetical protein
MPLYCFSLCETHGILYPKWNSLVSALTWMQADRDRLTHVLRGVAAELDGLDRELSAIEWQRGRATGPAISEVPVGELHCTQTALEAKREQLTTRLHVMAGQLNQLDLVLSGLRGHEYSPTGRVGTCPQCGYPSLESGMCAYCRPHLLTGD